MGSRPLPAATGAEHVIQRRAVATRTVLAFPWEPAAMSANPTHALSAEPAAPRALDPLQPTKGMVLASGF